MAYKRISPTPIIEGGTNTSSLSNTNGTVYFDGTKFADVSPGTATQILQSQGGAGNPPVFSTVSPSGGNGQFCAGGFDALIFSAVGNQYISIMGTSANFASPTNTAIVWPSSGTFDLLYTYVNFSSTTGNGVVTLMINGVDTALTLNVTAGTTGNFSDVVNSAAVSAGDAVCFHTSGGSSGTAQGRISVRFTS